MPCWSCYLKISTAERLFISAAKHQHIDVCSSKLQQSSYSSIGDQDVIITNMRHFQALTQALAPLERKANRFQSTGISGDFVSQAYGQCLTT